MKLAKLSLAAIMAVGAFSYASATPLENAIKGVDLSGYGYYRLHDASGSEAYSKFELRGQLSTSVTDNVKFTTRFTADSGSSAMNTPDSGGAATVDRVMIGYTGIANTNLILGRQYVGTPLDDTAGIGLKALVTPVSGLTLAAAYFTDNSASTKALTAVAAIYSSKVFNGRVWYVKEDSEGSGAKNGAKFLFVEAGANVGPVSVKGQYAQANPDATASFTAKTYRIQASGAVGPVTLRAGYTTNDKKAGDVTIDGSAEGDNDLIYGGIYGLVQNNQANQDSYFGEVKGSFGKVGVKAGYVSYNNGTYDDQYYGQVSYAVSKKLATYIRYGSASPVASGVADKTLARFQAQYNF
ncbi:MAG: porin [Epsilonproteobacteria bacterium]|nr:porin [Campylobacterota bacterium]